MSEAYNVMDFDPAVYKLVSLTNSEHNSINFMQGWIQANLIWTQTRIHVFLYLS